MAINWKRGIGFKAFQRLVELKNQKMKYEDIAKKLNKEFSFEEKITGDKCRHAFNRNKDWYRIKVSESTEIQEKNVEELVELYDKVEEQVDEDELLQSKIREAKEKAEKERDKKLMNKLLKERGLMEMIIETFDNSIRAFEWMDITPPEPIKPKNGRSEEALLLFSDAQIGEEIKPEETNGFGEYNIGIFKERMDLLIKKMRSIHADQSLAKNIKKLNIFMLGDNVDGIGIYRGQEHHLDALVVEQFLVATEKIAESLIRLLGSFQEIEVTGIIGNHGRMGRKGEYPMHLNWDYLIYKALERMLINYKDRIKWNIPLSNWTLRNIRGNEFLLLHGDTIKGWNGIPYYGIDRADSRFTKMLSGQGKIYKYMVLGHHHNPGDVDSANGEKILNGTMVGGSDFSINQLHTTSRPSQWFFGVDDKGITWRHKILLDEE